MQVERAPNRRKWLLAVLSGAFGCIAFDNSKLVAALPSLSARFHAGPTLVSALAEANILVYGGFLLLGGALGERFGARRMLLVGLGLFGSASFGGALAESAGSLLVARACVGAGAACITPATLAVIKQAFPDSERPRAIAIWTSSFGIGATLGPLVGGALLGQFGMLATLGSTALPASVCAWGVSACVPPNLPRRIAASRLSRHLRPRAIDLGLLSGDPRGRRALLAMSLSYFAFSGASFVVPQYLQIGRLASALESGLRAAPLAASLLLGTLFSARLIARWGASRALSSYLTLATIGALLLALACSSQRFIFVSLALVPFGFGSGGTFASATELILASVAPDRAPGAAALGECAFELGGAFGVAVLGAIANASAGPRSVIACGPRALFVGAFALLVARFVLTPRGRRKPAPV